jgi:hypothetical protein
MPPPPPQRKKLAQRIDLLLQRELGQGIDSQRMLAQPLYARDVLLVCDAMKGSELAQLAAQFRQATTTDDEPTSQAGSLWPDSAAAPLSIWPHTWLGGTPKRPRK